MFARIYNSSYSINFDLKGLMVNKKIIIALLTCALTVPTQDLLAIRRSTKTQTLWGTGILIALCSYGGDATAPVCGIFGIAVSLIGHYILSTPEDVLEKAQMLMHTIEATSPELRLKVDDTRLAKAFDKNTNKQIIDHWHTIEKAQIHLVEIFELLSWARERTLNDILFQDLCTRVDTKAELLAERVYQCAARIDHELAHRCSTTLNQ